LTVQALTGQAVRTMMTVEARMVNAERCLRLLTVPQEDSSGVLPYDSLISSEGWPSQGRVQFQNVRLRYRPDTEIVLDDLSFTVNPGEKIGIVGRTGAGKSTICLAMSRIVELLEG